MAEQTKAGPNPQATDVSRHMTLRKVTAPARDVNDTEALRGSRRASGVAEDRADDVLKGSPGTPFTHREIFIIARRNGTPNDTVIFTGDSGDQAVAVFTDREHAILYLQSAEWNQTHHPVSLSPIDLGDWLRERNRQGVTAVAVDPNHQHQIQGEPQTALSLEGRTEFLGDVLYHELRDLGGLPTP